MSEIGSISVSINGDASGLLSAAASAQSAVTALSTAVNGLKSQNVSLKLAAVDNATPVVNAATSTVTAFGTLKPQATITALDNTAPGVASATAAVNSVQDRVVTITVRVNQEGSIPRFASGTRSAPAGLARINDEQGAADPRELIYHRGNYYLFEGRDVLLPLDRGDQVFTASQTKNILRMNGIPSYASGKNNELFDFDKKLFKHSTKTSNMSITEQMEWWQSALDQYAYDSNVVMECGEEVFSLTKKLVKELNSASEVYVDERSKLNNWEEFGDTALEAFSRIRDRNFGFLDEGVITWEDYCKTLDKIGSNMYKERIKHSENWLNQAYKYNELSIDDYISGLNRMAEYTKEYYANGLIGDVDYFYGMQDIQNKKYDMRRKANAEEYRSWKKSADGYKKQRELYEDWDEWGDNLSKYYDRCIQRQNEFFAAGKIDWETYNDAVINYKMEQYKAEKSEAEKTYKTMLTSAKGYISEVKASFKAEKNELDYEFKTEELNSEFIAAARTRVQYRNAVTQKGKDVLAEAEEKMNKISREREQLELQREQNLTLETLENQYQEIENGKSVIISEILDGSIDMKSVLDSIEAQSAAGQGDICSLLSELIRTIQNGSGSTVYGGTTYNITGADASFMGPLLKRSISALAG